MDHDAPKRVKPKRGWFQYRLRTLLLLPVVVGTLLVLFLYWDDWRKHRPPYREEEVAEYLLPFLRFVNDLHEDRLDHA